MTTPATDSAGAAPPAAAPAPPPAAAPTPTAPAERDPSQWVPYARFSEVNTHATEAKARAAAAEALARQRAAAEGQLA